jgi:hypothetical protein
LINSLDGLSLSLFEVDQARRSLARSMIILSLNTAPH